MAETNGYTLAPTWRRILAYFIDFILINVLLYASISVMVNQRSLYAALGIMLLAGAYKPAMEAGLGWTIGKRSQKLAVVDVATTGPIDLNQALMRFLPWAMGIFASMLILITHWQDPQFAEVKDLVQYSEFSQRTAISQSWIIQVVTSLPVVSAFWMIADPLKQALHDKLGKTIVILEE